MLVYELLKIYCSIVFMHNVSLEVKFGIPVRAFLTVPTVPVYKVEEKSLAHFLFSTFLFWYDVLKMSEK